MNRPTLLDEEGDELEYDIEEDGYRPLDFDDTSKFDRRSEPELWDDLEILLDILEDEEAKDELDKEEEAYETQSEELEVV